MAHAFFRGRGLWTGSPAVKLNCFRKLIPKAWRKNVNEPKKEKKKKKRESTESDSYCDIFKSEI